MISRIALVAIMTLSAGAASQRQAGADDAVQIVGAVGHVVSDIIRATNGPRPNPSGGYVPVPRLGFDSFYNGSGEQVTAVRRGSLAWRLGLEPGDVIVAVSGLRLQYDGAWYGAMRRAVQQGHVTLAIRDWRTGRIVYRTLNQGGPLITGKG